MSSWSDRIHRGVIEDARGREGRERRRVIIAFALVAVAALMAFVLFGGRGTPRSSGVAANTGANQSVPTPAVAAAAVRFCWFPRQGTGGRMFSHDCVPAQPVKLLPPGIVTVASGLAPHDDPWLFSLQQIRAQGVKLLCTQARPIGSGQCFPYSDQPDAERAGNPPLSGSPAVRLTPGVGNCAAPVWNLITGLVMRPKLAVFFRSPDGTQRIPLVSLDPRLGVAGGAFATLITGGPVTLIARNSAGRTIYTTAVTNRGDKPTFCNGLDGGDWGLMTPAEAKASLAPTLFTYPFGRFVRAPGT